jgi:hypothetical protein
MLLLGEGMHKFLIGLLLVASTLYADLITTFDFDIEESALSFNRPNWGESQDVFYYNLVSFTVDIGGDWRAANNSITSHDSFDYSNNQTAFQNNPWYAADTYIYLYDDVFNPTNPTLNLIAEDDDGYDGGNGYQFDLTYNIKKDHTYYALITSFEPDEEIGGTVEVHGPSGASINMVIIPEPAAIGLIFGGGALILLLRKRK